MSIKVLWFKVEGNLFFVVLGFLFFWLSVFRDECFWVKRVLPGDVFVGSRSGQEGSMSTKRCACQRF